MFFKCSLKKLRYLNINYYIIVTNDLVLHFILNKCGPRSTFIWKISRPATYKSLLTFGLEFYIQYKSYDKLFLFDY